MSVELHIREGEGRYVDNSLQDSIWLKTNFIHATVILNDELKSREPYIAVEVRVQQRAVLHLHDLQCSGLIGAAVQLQLLADPTSLLEGKKERHVAEIEQHAGAKGEIVEAGTETDIGTVRVRREEKGKESERWGRDSEIKEKRARKLKKETDSVTMEK